MRARELAEYLHKLADEHGDLPVMVMDVEFDVHDPLTSVEVARQAIGSGGRLAPTRVFSINGRSSRDTLENTAPGHRQKARS